ncbi:MAG TPA: hypothetical protein P5300_13255 [Acidobacteriota bacterium]|nr:hypothetical protein [Acidobacteriota bacterium]
MVILSLHGGKEVEVAASLSVIAERREACSLEVAVTAYQTTCAGRYTSNPTITFAILPAIPHGSVQPKLWTETSFKRA